MVIRGKIKDLIAFRDHVIENVKLREGQVTSSLYFI